MPIEIQRIRAVCFDIDGTLSDTDNQIVARLGGRLTLLRYLIPETDTLRFARWLVMTGESPGTFLQGIADRWGIDPWTYRFVERLFAPSPVPQNRTHLLIPGVGGLIENLHKRYRLAIVSTRTQRAVTDFLVRSELQPFFNQVACGQTCRHTKPYPDPVLWVAEQMHIEPGECLMVGDTTVDMRAGKAAGAQTVGVLCGFGEEEELRRAGADLILNATPDLGEVLAESSPQNE